MEPIKINASPKAEHYHAIYYKDDRKSFFTWKSARTAHILLGISILSFAVVYFAVLYDPFYSWLYFITSILLLGSIIIQLIAFYNYFKWRKSVESYIKSILNNQSISLILTDETLEVLNDDQHTIVSKELLKSVIINKDHMIIYCEKMEFLVPEASLIKEDYEILKDRITQMMREQKPEVIATQQTML